MLSQVNIPYGALQPDIDHKIKGDDPHRVDLNGSTDQEDAQYDVECKTSVLEEGSLETGLSCDCHRNTMREDLDICVCNPSTDKNTTYEIKIQTVNPAFNLQFSHTRRRYNDFCWLRKMLKNHHPMCTCPELPSKKMFSERNEPQFLVERMKCLEDWLFRLLEVDLFLSDTTVHLFLQTNLTCSQIESYVNGRLSSAIVRQAYRACKLQSEHSFMRSMSKSPPDRPEPTHPIQVTKTESTHPIQVTKTEHTHPIQTKTKQSKSQQCDRCADSGVTMSDSSDNDSSYESQSGYSSSSDMNGTFPNLTEVTAVNTQVRDHIHSKSAEGQKVSCDQDSISASSSQGSPSSLRIISRQNSSPRRRKDAEKRVEMGVIFSINSI